MSDLRQRSTAVARRLAIQAVPKHRRTQLQGLYRPVLARALAGSAVSCPLCGGSFRCFLPQTLVGGEVLANARCPRCGALERQRCFALFLLGELDARPGRDAVLHFAPEPGLAEQLQARPDVEYLSGDLDGRLAMASVDITAIDRPDGSFDVVLANHVLEHVPDDAKAMRELRRVLRPGGFAVLTTPYDRTRTTSLEDPSITSPADRERVYGQLDHVRLYGTDLFDRMRTAGFDVERAHPAQALSDADRRRYGVSVDEEIVVCRPTAG